MARILKPAEKVASRSTVMRLDAKAIEALHAIADAYGVSQRVAMEIVLLRVHGLMQQGQWPSTMLELVSGDQPD